MNFIDDAAQCVEVTSSSEGEQEDEEVTSSNEGEQEDEDMGMYRPWVAAAVFGGPAAQEGDRRPPDRYTDTDHTVFDDDDDDVWSDGGDFNGCDDGGVESAPDMAMGRVRRDRQPRCPDCGHTGGCR